MQAMYARRATAASAAAEKHLKGLVTFASPKAGMFMWFKLTGACTADEGHGSSQHAAHPFSKVHMGCMQTPKQCSGS